MIKSILVPLQGHAADVEALSGAQSIARLFDAHIECLHVRPDPRLMIAGATSGFPAGVGAGAFPAELWNVVVDADKRRAAQARQTFDAFCQKSGISVDASTKGLGAAFREAEGDAAREITMSARYSDLAVFAHDDLTSEVFWDTKSHVIIGSGRPVLLVPAKVRLDGISTIAIAWKDTAEAARAVTAAMPLLHKAKTVVVMSAREGAAKVEDVLRSAEHVAGLLRRHDIAARAEHIPADDKGPAGALVARASALKANLLVMGAYGHGRLREFVFGGFTKHVLNETNLPTLVAH
jgi:nucleotide-binding universal stress UspA family protein